MHPMLLESTVRQCREYIEAGDCHGAPPPIERLIEAVVELADKLSTHGVQGMEAAPAGKRWQCVRCGEAHARRHHTGECATPNCHSVNLKEVCGNCLGTGYRDEGGRQIPCDACGVLASDVAGAQALMQMTETEIDAELRSMGIDPAEAERQGKAAVEGALETIRQRNAGVKGLGDAQ
jgi:hypothetical protein